MRAQPQRRLVEQLGRPRRHHVLEVLTRQQYELGVTVNPGGNGFFAQPLMLRRTMIFGDHDMDAFKAKLQLSRGIAP